MKKVLLSLLLVWVAFVCAYSQSSVAQCGGTSSVYPEIKESAYYYPNDMTPFYISHLGRHGSRYPTSDKALKSIYSILDEAFNEGMLTDAGSKLKDDVAQLLIQFKGHYGALSSVGTAQQQSIAIRCMERFPVLAYPNCRINAISTYVPRAISSMKAFMGKIQSVNATAVCTESHGKEYNSILRFFDCNDNYVHYKQNGKWKKQYEHYRNKTIPADSVFSIFFKSGMNVDASRKMKFAMDVMSAGAILQDVNTPINWSSYISFSEWGSYWKVENLGQYLAKAASVVGEGLPVAIAWPLLDDFVNKADSVINGTRKYDADFRFAHAETLIPFAALIGIEKADTTVADIDDVFECWKDYEVSPMAANIQWIFVRDSLQKVWVRILLNEHDARISNLSTTRFPYYEWSKIVVYMREKAENARKLAVNIL